MSVWSSKGFKAKRLSRVSVKYNIKDFVFYFFSVMEGRDDKICGYYLWNIQ